jgi:hypothetical protein
MLAFTTKNLNRNVEVFDLLMIKLILILLKTMVPGTALKHLFQNRS